MPCWLYLCQILVEFRQCTTIYKFTYTLPISLFGYWIHYVLDLCTSVNSGEWLVQWWPIFNSLLIYSLFWCFFNSLPKPLAKHTQHSVWNGDRAPTQSLLNAVFWIIRIVLSCPRHYGQVNWLLCDKHISTRICSLTPISCNSVVPLTMVGTRLQ